MTKSRPASLFTLGFAAAAALAALAGCNQTPAKPVADEAAQVDRGRLLVSIGGCARSTRCSGRASGTAKSAR